MIKGPNVDKRCWSCGTAGMVLHDPITERSVCGLFRCTECGARFMWPKDGMKQPMTRNRGLREKLEPAYRWHNGRYCWLKLRI